VVAAAVVVVGGGEAVAVMYLYSTDQYVKLQKKYIYLTGLTSSSYFIEFLTGWTTLL
jgi:hypothetical protein